MKKNILVTLSLFFTTIATIYSMEQPLPIVYHHEYNIVKSHLVGKVLGLLASPFINKLHPFDSEKYGKVYNKLCERFNLSAKDFYQPYDIASIPDGFEFDEWLDRELIELNIHTPEYLASLHNPVVIQSIAEVPGLAWLSNKTLQEVILHPMRLATAGTYMACTLALTHPHHWAINLSGGYHHAKSNSGSGFCYFADIPYAVTKLWQTNPKLRVMIIDLDAHQGNGYEAFFKYDPRIAVFDVYNANRFPRDYSAAQYIRYRYALTPNMDDPISQESYMALLQIELPKAINEFRPELIIYNAGTDIFDGDPIGGMHVSAEGINERDLFVFDQAEQKHIPIAMILSGGYTPESADIIANSITAILGKKALEEFNN